MQQPTPDVVALWYHYEEIAMHFDSLTMHFRLQLIGGAAAIGTAAAYFIGGKVVDPPQRRLLRTIVSSFLVVLIISDLVLAQASGLAMVAVGVALWGLHMGMTQGLLATMVAGTAPANLRGTAFGFFNLVSGIAMLIASVLAGLLWDKLGADVTFYAGAVFALLAFFMLVSRRGRPA